MYTSGLQLQSQQIKLAASGIVGLFTAGLVQMAVAPHSLAKMVTVFLITVPNTDPQCRPGVPQQPHMRDKPHITGCTPAHKLY